VGGVGMQKIESIVNGQSFVALVLQAKIRANQAEKKSKFGLPLIRGALLKSGVDERVISREWYGLLVGEPKEHPIECIRGDIFISKPGLQPEKAVKAPAKKWKASEGSSSGTRPGKKAAKRKAPKKRQAEQAHPQRTSDSSSSSSTRTQKKQKAAGSTAAAAAAAAAAPDNTAATSAKYAAAAQSEQDEDNSAAADALQTQINSIAQQLGATGSSAETVATTIKALQDAAAAAQRERAEAVADLQAANADTVKLQADISAAQQDKLALEARADQLSTENTDLKAKLSAAEDDLSTAGTSATAQLSGVNAELNTVKAALESAGTELGQKAAAMTELGEQVRNVNTMLKRTLSDEVSNA
jgi:DNA repair exonuclease SbcCD ATPase subunit